MQRMMTVEAVAHVPCGKELYVGKPETLVLCLECRLFAKLGCGIIVKVPFDITMPVEITVLPREE